MNLKKLRRDVPAWTWKAERDGFGWNYVGTCGDKRVTVRPYSVLAGYGDDDFSTVWYVSDGETSVSWWMWQPAREAFGRAVAAANAASVLSPAPRA